MSGQVGISSVPKVLSVIPVSESVSNGGIAPRLAAPAASALEALEAFRASEAKSALEALSALAAGATVEGGAEQPLAEVHRLRQIIIETAANAAAAAPAAPAAAEAAGATIEGGAGALNPCQMLKQMISETAAEAPAPAAGATVEGGAALEAAEADAATAAARVAAAKRAAEAVDAAAAAGEGWPLLFHLAYHNAFGL